MGGADKPANVGTFTAKEPLKGWVVGMDEVKLAQTDPTWKLWDTREGKEWKGEELKKGAFRKGRIPWATFQNWKEYKQPVEGEKEFTEFKDAAGVEAVIAKFGMTPEQHHVFYCQSGVRTTTGMFALYLMGWDPAQLHNYDGSWIEWSYHQDTPVVVEAE
jgi:thiosulfate/3-mercaptopyruvate sulfurtransferase